MLRVTQTNNIVSKAIGGRINAHDEKNVFVLESKQIYC